MLAGQINKHIQEGSAFFSLEFFPPQVTQACSASKGIDNYRKTLKSLNDANPLFVDVTWFARNDPGWCFKS
jgi:5,10-methylenetetrahydrofolate reductase